MTTQELISDFLNDIEHLKGRSENTILAYQSDLRQWQQFLENNDLDVNLVERRDLLSFIAQLLKNRKIDRRTQARKIIVIKQFYQYLVNKKVVSTYPFHRLLNVKYQRSLPRPIQPVDMTQILEDDSGQKEFIQKRDMALWELAYSSGMRISEILSLKISDIYQNNNVAETIKITGKGNKHRLVFVGKAAANALLAYMSCRRSAKKKAEGEKTEKLFVNFRQGPLTRRGALFALQQRARHLELAIKIGPHSFRHSFGTDLINEGADIRTVQELLGHSSVSTTQNYTQVARDRLFQIFRSSHPHAKKK